MSDTGPERSLSFNGLPIVCQEESHLLFSSVGERSFFGYVSPISRKEAASHKHGLAGWFTGPQQLLNCFEASIRTNFADGATLLSTGERFVAEGAISIPAVNPEDHNCYKISFSGPGSSERMGALRSGRPTSETREEMFRRIVTAALVLHSIDHQLAGQLHTAICADLHAGLELGECFNRCIHAADERGFKTQSFPGLNGNYKLGAFQGAKRRD